MMALESKTQALARNNVFGGSPDRSVEELSKYKAVTKKILCGYIVNMSRDGILSL